MIRHPAEGYNIVVTHIVGRCDENTDTIEKCIQSFSAKFRLVVDDVKRAEFPQAGRLSGRCLISGKRPDGKIPHCHPYNLPIHLMQRLVQLEQFSAAQLQRMFIRLIDRSDFIIQVWRATVFDVISQDMRHDLILSETH
jgi:hypothetical protein